MPHILRKIPFRAINQRLRVAAVIDNCASWHCVCGEPVALQGRSGAMAGPTPDTVVRCARCSRLYFVIPQDRSFGPPVEVIELLGLPPATAEPLLPPEPAPAAHS